MAASEAANGKSRLVELARIETRMGNLHAQYKTPDHIVRARELFSTASARLDEGQQAESSGNHAHDIATLQAYIDRQRTKLDNPDSETKEL